MGYDNRPRSNGQVGLSASRLVSLENVDPVQAGFSRVQKSLCKPNTKQTNLKKTTKLCLWTTRNLCYTVNNPGIGQYQSTKGTTGPRCGMFPICVTREVNSTVRHSVDILQRLPNSPCFNFMLTKKNLLTNSVLQQT